MKTCTDCGEAKPPSQFHRNATRRDGLQYSCKPCRSQQEQERYRKNSEVECERNTKYRRANAVRLRDYYLRRHYGITLEGYEALLETQGGRCGICGSERSGGHGNFHVDHDHTCCPGKVSCGKCIRGLLCMTCNSGLGKLGDCIAGLERAIGYLKQGL